MIDEEMMTVGEVAVFLRVTPRTVYSLIRERAIPNFKVGGQYRFRKTLLESWLKESPARQAVET